MGLLQLARARRDQLIREERWIDAPTVHVQQGGLSILPKDRSGWRQALWLFQRHGQLEGKRPADVFQKDPEAVIKAARSDFEINDER